MVLRGMDDVGAGELSTAGAAVPGRARWRVALVALGVAVSLLAAMSLYPTLARAEVGEEPQVLIQTATAVGRTAATLNAVVNPNGSNVEPCEFEYATTKQAVEKEEGSEAVECSPNPGSGENLVSVSSVVSGLKESTTYYFRVVATNEFGSAQSTIAHFTTLPTAPKATISNATSVGRTSATLRGSVNPEASNVEECYFQVATSLAYESPTTVPCVSSPGSGESTVPVSGNATGLTQHTTYFYRVVAKNAFGTTFSAASAKFTTPPTKPEVTTESANEIARTSVTLNAVVRPRGAETSCEFEYGTSLAFEHKVPCTTPLGSGEGAVQVELHVSGLAEGTTYYFRAVATNEFGTAFGGHLKFTTLPSPPKVHTNEATKRSANSAQLNATVNPDGNEVTKCEFEWGTSLAYGKHTPCSALPGAGETPVAVSAQLTGLAASTTYDYRIVASNGLGTTFGGNVKFTTSVTGVPPTFKKLEPRKGSTVGGTHVTIVGTGFTEATVVMFGSAEATSFKVESDTKIIAVTPAEPAATVQVTVTTPSGTTETSSKSTYKFQGVVVASVSPAGGPAAGGTPVTITGSGFALGSSGTVFHFGKAAATSVECTTSSECTAVAPPEVAGDGQRAGDRGGLDEQEERTRRPLHLQLSAGRPPTGRRGRGPHVDPGPGTAPVR